MVSMENRVRLSELPRMSDDQIKGAGRERR